MTNALQYGARDTPIRVQVEEDREETVLSVNNQGPIIPEEHFPTLFDAFQKGQATSRDGGLGLGLHIVYEIVKAHGGKVEVTSNAERGTTFTARFKKPPGTADVSPPDIS